MHLNVSPSLHIYYILQLLVLRIVKNRIAISYRLCIYHETLYTIYNISNSRPNIVIFILLKQLVLFRQSVTAISIPTSIVGVYKQTRS